MRWAGSKRPRRSERGGRCHKGKAEVAPGGSEAPESLFADSDAGGRRTGRAIVRRAGGPALLELHHVRRARWSGHRGSAFRPRAGVVRRGDASPVQRRRGEPAPAVSRNRRAHRRGAGGGGAAPGVAPGRRLPGRALRWPGRRDPRGARAASAVRGDRVLPRDGGGSGAGPISVGGPIGWSGLPRRSPAGRRSRRACRFPRRRCGSCCSASSRPAFLPTTCTAGAPSCSCPAPSWSDVLGASRVAVIVGPTAIGKTAVASALAAYFPLEVISADSRQIYRRLDIGTAKPTRRERQKLPHHGIDMVDPGTRYSAGRFAREAGWLDRRDPCSEAAPGGGRGDRSLRPGARRGLVRRAAPGSRTTARAGALGREP